MQLHTQYLVLLASLCVCTLTQAHTLCTALSSYSVFKTSRSHLVFKTAFLSSKGPEDDSPVLHVYTANCYLFTFL